MNISISKPDQPVKKVSDRSAKIENEYQPSLADRPIQMSCLQQLISSADSTFLSGESICSLMLASWIQCHRGHIFLVFFLLFNV